MNVKIAILAAAAAATLLASTGASAQEDDLAALLGSGGRVSGEALEARIAKAAEYPLGSRENPVRVNMPDGQRSYLRRLRCANGAPPDFSRSGSAGPGPFGSIVDAYSVTCRGSEPAQSVIFMDMYHPTHDETRAPPGFTMSVRPRQP